MSDEKKEVHPRKDGISRRDFVHGLTAAGIIASLPEKSMADLPASPRLSATEYPPAKTGLRGNHDGSWEVAHSLVRSPEHFKAGQGARDKESYDLLVVGGGISGLAAAYFYKKSQPDARILILENHDDFGGHAKRNEFSVAGKQLVGYGGSQTMEEPSDYSQVVKDLLNDIGVRPEEFYQAYDQTFYKEHDLGGGVFFNRGDWGRSAMVKLDVGGLSDYMPLAPTSLSVADAVMDMPLSAPAKSEFIRLMTETRDCMPEIPVADKRWYLSTISYKTFLERHLGMKEAEVFRVLEDLASDTGMSIANVTASAAIFYSVLPGYNATGLPPDHEEYEPYIHHFPDGNATVARLLVSSLIPAFASPTDGEGMVGVHGNYAGLDQADNDVCLRLGSTAVNVAHKGDPGTAREVEVTYVKDSYQYIATAKKVVLACYHSIIPAICPSLPSTQKTALASQVKTPILYTNVALTNWRAWKEMGIGAFVAPGSYHVNAMIDFPVSMGDYQFAQSPDDPIVIHMEKFPHGRAPGLSKRDRLRQGRRNLLATPFSEIEHQIKLQLGEALAPGGFDIARDIAGITVNRWAHGYSYYYDELVEDLYDDWGDPRYPHVQARQLFGQIAIANSDADANAMLQAAIEQGYRAVQELLA